MEKVFILFGSNQGDKLQFFRKAELLIQDRIGSIVMKSSLYQTAPWGFESDEEFLNQVVVVETSRDADSVMTDLLEFEKQLGRRRSSDQTGYQSRVIDLDILFFGDSIIDNDFLVVPHPRMIERRFVLQPLSEIVPGMIHPVFGITISEMLSNCKDKEAVKKLDL
jgi:2-amino-4-hydroxy-6-hydroxymethyldihydropteridine diphosphokinase